jgi:hypothetical protein
MCPGVVFEGHAVPEGSEAQQGAFDGQGVDRLVEPTRQTVMHCVISPVTHLIRQPASKAPLPMSAALYTWHPGCHKLGNLEQHAKNDVDTYDTYDTRLLLIQTKLPVQVAVHPNGRFWAGGHIVGMKS